MHTTETAQIGTTRNLAAYRLADVRASEEAKAALRAAAHRAKKSAGPEADLLIAFAEGDARPLASLASPALLQAIPAWITELRGIAATRPGTGACTAATGLQIWLWTMDHFRATPEADVATADLADAFGPLLAARCRILELVASPAPDNDTGAFQNDLSHVFTARAAAAAGTTCAELVFGYRRHLSWDAEGCASCYKADEIDELDGLIPGIASTARAYADVVEAGGGHAAKAGPCAKADGVEVFTHLRARLDGCLTGARRAKDRAAARLAS